MPSMISAARSRDIRFLLVVQSLSSLKQRYSDEAETIISNCTNWIFFTSRELSLLKELSELCGTQKNHMPNISIYDLQHLSKERREALVLSGRFKPAIVTMLDIDKFGDRSYTLLRHERRERLQREKLSFDLREDIKSKYIPQLPPNPFAERNLFNNGTSIGSSGLSSDAQISDGLETDTLIKRIDQRIAELKKEDVEKQDKKESSSESINTDTTSDAEGE